MRSSQSFLLTILLPIFLLGCARAATAVAQATGPTSAPTSGATAQVPPVVPVGLDAYRMWDRWAYQRLGERAYMRSTYDRTGGNESADASHFLFQLADDFNVTLDVENPGVLYFARYNHWHGSPWHYVVDGADHVVQETTTADPTRPKGNSVFLPAEVFPNPLTWTWSTTRGADLSWLPIAFEKSFRMAYGRTCYGTGYYIYHQFVPGTRLSQPIKAWDGSTPPDKDVLDLLGRAGSDLVPQPDSPEGKTAGIQQRSGEVTVPAGGSMELLDLHTGPSMIRALDISAPADRALALGHLRLRVTWDDRPTPSIDTPLPLFFGAGTLYNRDKKEYLVKALPMVIRFDADQQVHLSCYFPMPFFKSAKFELVSDAAAPIGPLRWSVRWLTYTDPLNHVAYFHATYQDYPTPESGRDLVLLDTTKTEGGGDWTGSFVGTSFIFSHEARLGTLEGDPRFFFDDSHSPQAYGTGTEEWGGGGDYWGGRTMTLPLAGHPVGAPDARGAKSDEDKIESAYRFLLADLMPFGRNALICLEHGGTNDANEHYETLTYWYGLPGASLVPTDQLKIADAASEAAHQYVSPQASEPVEITSAYELGLNDKKHIFPPHTERGRTTTGTSEFTLKIDPANLGVMLRRKLDYSYPNQRAEVFIADASSGKAPTDADFKPAGFWYLAGGSTCVYSRPNSELGPTEHNIRLSNRHFRDDEYLLPRDLTAGRSAIRVRVKFTPVEIPLFPGNPLAKLVWSEIRYDAYCYVMPPLPVK